MRPPSLPPPATVFECVGGPLDGERHQTNEPPNALPGLAIELPVRRHLATGAVTAATTRSPRVGFYTLEQTAFGQFVLLWRGER